MNVTYGKVDIQREGDGFRLTVRIGYDDAKGLRLSKRVDSIQDGLREVAKLLDRAEAGVADA